MDKLRNSITTLFRDSITNSNSKRKAEGNIECIAIDQLGEIGSMYSRHEDRMLGKLYHKGKTQWSKSNSSAIYKLYHFRMIETENLLKMVDIDSSMRLSILLQIVQPSGIASIQKYPQAIDQNTRFLYIYHEGGIQACKTDLLKDITSNNRDPLDCSITHIISQIVFGVHAVLVLQLPPDEAGQIDPFLEEIRDNLEKYECFKEVRNNNRNILSKIISTKVYSNIPTLSSITNFHDIICKIFELRHNCKEHRPMKYILTPFEPNKSEQDSNNLVNVIFDESDVKLFENNLLQHSTELKRLDLLLYHTLPELLQDKCEDQLNNVRLSFQGIKEFSDNIMSQIGQLLVNIRKNKGTMDSINEILNSDARNTIDYSTGRLWDIINKLKAKGDMIRKLQNDGFEYNDVTKLGIDDKCTDGMIKEMLFKGDMNKLIFCSTDKFKDESKEQWSKIYTQAINERQKNPQLTLTYADFTYSTWSLGESMILPPKETTINRDLSRQSDTVRKTKRKAPLAPKDEYTNLVLIGESGVGKSTFINAFANYLRYSTLKDAESDKPFVIIPVSFLMTINDNFDERLVKFGEADQNEDHSHSGRSVTQQCRCYVFEMSTGKKLRIIDTPGFGDTRGVDQDELNMEMIFSFLHNFSHLDGICFLFKPNVQQLNPFLYSCYTQLFQFFGENIRQNFIFCFTNARSTFFAPGDTRPVLLSFFNSFPVKQIPFEKKNTFCFDSESFRYLVALQNSLTFQEIERDEFDRSWVQSVQQSKRLETYLCKELSPYRKNKEWQSIKEAQLQINLLIRPILEAMRHILRNILLHSIQCMIELKAILIQESTVICYSDKRSTGKFGSCLILLDHLHSSTNQCTSDQHALATYRLEYTYRANYTDESIDILKKHRTLLCKVAARFAHFLQTTQVKQKDDPFVSGLNRMIQEEHDIFDNDNRNTVNQQLMDELNKLKNEYEQLCNRNLDTNDKLLSVVYNLIQSLHDIPIVKEQLNAIEIYQQNSITAAEKNINVDSTYF